MGVDLSGRAPGIVLCGRPTLYIGVMGQSRANWRSELRAMVALAVPVVLSELGWMAQGVVDTIMVGRLGPAAIGAVALGNAVCYTPSLFGVGLMLGLDTLVAQAYGREDHDECHRWLAQGVYLACIAAIPFMIAIGLASFFFARFGITPEVAVPAGGYTAAPAVGHAAAAALRRGAALFAGRGPGARDHCDLRCGEPGELVSELGADLRQAGYSGAGRERIGDFDGRLRALRWRLR